MAQDEADCYIRHREHNISIMYERVQYFNWFIVAYMEEMAKRGARVCLFIVQSTESEKILLKRQTCTIR